ncbi:hypothetical protein F2Q68_00024959 [Brassica cretica]|uniref:Uncharacterized protein n=1 Tax=Brassica cretica TaxID=69181 RepID=A0A8S9IKI3_BRACR|nr:hypothetical protein F2Q68_00024959 [Brassica cretica]
MGDGEDRIINALTDMDIADKQDDGLMDCDFQNDDLMGIRNLGFSVEDLHISVHLRLMIPALLEKRGDQDIILSGRRNKNLCYPKMRVRWGPRTHPPPINEDTQLELSREWERPHSSTPKGDVSEASPRTCVPY